MAVLWLLLRVRWRRAFAPALAVALLIGGIGGFVSIIGLNRFVPYRKLNREVSR